MIDSFDCHEVFPNLFQGSIPPEGYRLREAGFGAVVLCAKEHQPPVHYFPGIDVIYAPNNDNSDRPVTRDELKVAINAAKQVVKRLLDGKRVMVTCQMGWNRSGLVNALTIHLMTGESGTMCAARVQANRPNSLYNEQFLAALAKIDAKTKAVQAR